KALGSPSLAYDFSKKHRHSYPVELMTSPSVHYEFRFGFSDVMINPTDELGQTFDLVGEVSRPRFSLQSVRHDLAQRRIRDRRDASTEPLPYVWDGKNETT